MNQELTKKIVRRFYVLNFVNNFCFTLSIWVIFCSSYLGLSYVKSFILMFLPVVVIGLVFEVPSGAFAGKYGRKFAYLIGNILVILGTTPMRFSKEFFVLLLGVIVAEVGVSLSSGSMEAIVSESAESSNNNYIYGNITANSISLRFIARAIGAPLGAYAYTVDPRLPFLLIISASFVTLLLALKMPESKGEIEHRVGVIKMVKQAALLVGSVKHLGSVLLLFSMCVLSLDLVFFTHQPNLQRIDIDVL